MLREDLGHIVTSAVDCLIRAGELPEAARLPVEIIDTKQPEHGDYATNFALSASKSAGMNPRQLAEKLREKILEVDEAGVDDPTPQARKMVAEGSPAHPDPRPSLIHEIEIAGPGFLNFRLKPEAIAAYVATVLKTGPIYPRPKPENPKSKINVEFVSVNPNGPITVGSARGAAFGDTLCRVFEAAGHEVNREYYINDGVNSEQMRLFAESVRHYYREGEGFESAFPEKGYRGDYVLDVARAVREIHGVGQDRALTEWFQQRSQELMLERQRVDLATFGVNFDTWFSEQSLHDSGVVAKCVEELIAKGVADEDPTRTVLKLARGGVIEEVRKEPQTDAMEEEEIPGEDDPTPQHPNTPTPSPLSSTPNTQHQTPSKATLWLRSTKFGDDMDRVLRRRDGRLTYIASDVAYHKDKFNRPPNADRLITVLGPDHHGYIHRLQAVLAALLETPSPEWLVSGEGAGGEGPDSSPNSVSPGVGAGDEAKGEVLQSSNPPILTPNTQHPIPNTVPLDEVEAQLFRSPEERDACKSALEEAKSKLDVVIFQVVRFMKDGKPAPMRKRDGNIYELRDLINEVGQTVAAKATKEEQQRVGADVARFFYLMRSHETSMDFDIDLATRQSDDNPVFYVQYAHARICSVLRKARESGIGEGIGYVGIAETNPGAPNTPTPQHPNTLPNTLPNTQHPIPNTFPNTSLLLHPREATLIKKILDFPMEVQRCAEDYGVHRLTTYAIELARTYHHFYDACRVIQADQPELSQARLALCEACRLTLNSALDLIGVSAPKRMDRGERDTGTED